MKKHDSTEPEAQIMDVIDALMDWFINAPAWAQVLFHIRGRFLIPMLKVIFTKKASVRVENFLRKYQPHEPLRLTVATVIPGGRSIKYQVYWPK